MEEYHRHLQEAMDLSIKRFSSPQLSDTSIGSESSNDTPTRVKRVSKVYSSAMKEKAVKLYTDGTSKAEIARQLRVPGSTIRGWIKIAHRQGLSVVTPKPSPLRRRTISGRAGSTESTTSTGSSNNIDDNPKNISAEPPLKRFRSSSNEHEHSSDPQKGREFDDSILLSDPYSSNDSKSFQSTMFNNALEQLNSSTTTAQIHDNPTPFSTPVRPLNTIPQQSVDRSLRRSVLTPVNNFQNLSTITSYQQDTPAAPKSSRKKRKLRILNDQVENENINSPGTVTNALTCQLNNTPVDSPQTLMIKKARRRKRTKMSAEEQEIKRLKRIQRRKDIDLMMSVVEPQQTHADAAMLWAKYYKDLQDGRNDKEQDAQVNLEVSNGTGENEYIDMELKRTNEAIKHGEELLHWMENSPKVELLPEHVELFRVLLNNIKAARTLVEF